MLRPFQQIDVFASGPFSGNPLAVVMDGEGLHDTDMQRFANWTNLSETTFLLPPTVDGADYRVRIFTASHELPFAGHPTLGSCHAWLSSAGAGAGHEGDTIVQECGAGLVTLRRGEQGLAFAAPPRLRFGPVDEPVVVELARALGIERADIVDAEWADNGPGWVAVLLSSADAVLALRPEASDYDIGVIGPYPEGSPVAFEIRAFFPAGGVVMEDPVTGSLNAAVGEWLITSGRAPTSYVASQGTALGRAGRIRVSAEDDRIWVEGATVTRIEGTVDL
jgi:PhzF family phenazine biosynthesis protein